MEGLFTGSACHCLDLIKSSTGDETMNISALADGSTSYRQGIQSSQALTKPQPWRFHLEERKQTPGPASKALPASVHLDRRHLERARNGLNSLFHDVALKKQFRSLLACANSIGANLCVEKRQDLEFFFCNQVLLTLTLHIPFGKHSTCCWAHVCGGGRTTMCKAGKEKALKANGKTRGCEDVISGC